MLRTGSGLIALLSLAACLAAPVMHFQGTLDAGGYQRIFLVASLGWFVFATIWASRRGKTQG